MVLKDSSGDLADQAIAHLLCLKSVLQHAIVPFHSNSCIHHDGYVYGACMYQ
jgi:hypothetical protein